MNVEIIEANLSDPGHGAAVIEVLNAYAADPMGGGEPLSADVQRRLISGLREQPTALVLLAFDGEQAVGIAVCFFGYSTFRASPLLNIHDLAVVPEHRRRGIGRALLEAVEARARERKCCKLTLEVLEKNATARRVYASFGFADPDVGGLTATRFLNKPLSE